MAMAAKKAAAKKRRPRLLRRRSSNELRKFWRICDSAYRLAEKLVEKGVADDKIPSRAVQLAIRLEVELAALRPSDASD